MLRATRLVVAALVALVTAVSVAPAFAAPAGWQSIDVTLQTEQKESMLLVSGELEPAAKLPAEAELAVPAGTQIQWIGEILGGDPSKDPTLKYTKSSAQGMDVYRFTLTKSRIAQVEGVVQGMGGFDGSAYSTALKWTAWQSVPEVRISGRIPQGAQIASTSEGASVQPGGSGYSYYTKTVKEPKTGDVLDLTFSYTLPAAGTTSGGGTASSSSVAPVLIAILAAAAFAFAIYKVWLKMSAKTVAASPVKTKPSQPSAVKPSTKSGGGRRSAPAAPVAEAPPTKRANILIPMVVIVGILMIGFLYAGNRGTTARTAGTKITKEFGAASPCTAASIPIMAKQGVDLAAQGEQLVDAFNGQEGVGEVTLDIAQSNVDIKFCESSQTEESVRKILTDTGLVDVGAAPVAAAPATATVDPTGKTQTASVDTANGAFSPATVVLKAGVPSEIAFGAANSCITEVIFSELGVKQDLTAGPATVKLPALDAGTYAYACPMGHQTGELVVQ